MMEMILTEYLDFLQASGSGADIKVDCNFRHMVKGGSFPTYWD